MPIQKKNDKKSPIAIPAKQLLLLRTKTALPSLFWSSTGESGLKEAVNCWNSDRFIDSIDALPNLKDAPWSSWWSIDKVITAAPFQCSFHLCIMRYQNGNASSATVFADSLKLNDISECSMFGISGPRFLNRLIDRFCHHYWQITSSHSPQKLADA